MPTQPWPLFLLSSVLSFPYPFPGFTGENFETYMERFTELLEWSCHFPQDDNFPVLSIMLAQVPKAGEGRGREQYVLPDTVLHRAGKPVNPWDS